MAISTIAKKSNTVRLVLVTTCGPKNGQNQYYIKVTFGIQQRWSLDTGGL